MGIDGTFLNVITEFMTGRKERVIVGGQCHDCRNIISGISQGSVLDPLLFILYTSVMWSGLENRLVAYTDGALLFFLSVPSPYMWPLLQPLHRDLAKNQCLL